MSFLSTHVMNSHPHITLCSDVQVWKDTQSQAYTGRASTADFGFVLAY